MVRPSAAAPASTGETRSTFLRQGCRCPTSATLRPGSDIGRDRRAEGGTTRLRTTLWRRLRDIERMFETFAARRVATPRPVFLAARRLRPAGAVSTLDRHLLHGAQRDPDLARRHPGGESLLGRAVAELDDDGVAQQHAPEGTELVVDGPAELGEFQRTSERPGRRRTARPGRRAACRARGRTTPPCRM